MEIETAVRTRRSIRAFTSRPVDEDTLRELLDLARWSPSWANTQSWYAWVATGATLERIKAAFRAKTSAGAPRALELPPPSTAWPEDLAARTRRLYEARAAAVGDGPAPSNADFFGAPCAVLFGVDARLEPTYPCFDLGLLVQTFCLAAHGRGLGTCIMAMGVAYPDVLRAALPSTDGKRFVVGVALGYPDTQAPVNGFERTRADLAELTAR